MEGSLICGGIVFLLTNAVFSRRRLLYIPLDLRTIRKAFQEMYDKQTKNIQGGGGGGGGGGSLKGRYDTGKTSSPSGHGEYVWDGVDCF